MSAPLPEAAWWVAVAALPDVGPARMGALQEQWSGPEAWRRLLDGSAVRRPEVAERLGAAGPQLGEAWRAAARALSVDQLWQQHADAGVAVAVPGDARMPLPFAEDPDPPRVLFSLGDLALLDGPRVGIVGTRRASRYGRDIAFELGHDLAQAGVRVVSGLALGIDGAAHRGVLAAREAGAAAPPIGVVASGLDTCYPAEHRSLWERVATEGVLFTEAPLGLRPARWRFPARNRLIAALSDVLVVVESPTKGGALLTADDAADRGRPVLAVPGSVRARCAAGALDLLADNAHVCRDAVDVLVALGLVPGGRRRAKASHVADPADREVLDAIGWQAATLEQIAVRTGLPLAELSLALARLESGGWLAADGAWFERTSAGRGT